MGWEALFADLSGEFDAAEAAELAAEVSDRTRRERSRLRITDRLRSAVGEPVTVTVPHLGVLRGTLVDVGPDWLLVTETSSRQVLVPVASVLALGGLGPWAAEPDRESAVDARLRLGYALRVLARDRASVVLTLTDGSVRRVTIDAVGADHVAVAEQAVDDGRRSRDVRDATLVPFTALVAIRST